MRKLKRRSRQPRGKAAQKVGKASHHGSPSGEIRASSILANILTKTEST